MKLSVARCYHFYGTHAVPGLALPWSAPHRHRYTVEVVASGDLKDGLVVDTDFLDETWRTEGLNEPGGGHLGHDLNKRYGGENTTVELLAQRWLALFREAVPDVVAVTVWEDDSRWGRAQA